MGTVNELRADQPAQQISSKLQYSSFLKTRYQLELGEYPTYGIMLIDPGQTNILHDVSVSKETTEHIVELLNRYQVSPTHLYDVVTDMLP